MKTAYTLSVVTVVLNDAEGLARTIASIESQTYTSIELVVIDGGSTDGTLTVIQEYSGLIRKYVSEPDRGIYHAMNKGLQYATGEWVCFLNAGDCFTERTVVEQCFSVDRQFNHLIVGNNEFVRGRVSKLRTASDLSCLWKGMVVNHQSVMIRRNVVLDHLFDETVSIVADFDSLCRCYLAGLNAAYINIVLSTTEADGLSDKKMIQTSIETWRIARRYFPGIKTDLYHMFRVLRFVLNKTFLTFTPIGLRERILLRLF